jgi:hypothetical protein
MKFNIFKEEGSALLGSFEQSEGGDFMFTSTNQGVSEMLQGFVQKGVFVQRDIALNDGSIVMVRGPLPVTDPNFALGLAHHLEEQGYLVIEEHAEMDAHMKKLIGNLPESETKEEVLRNFANLSYLEKTALLEILDPPVEEGD